MSNDKLLCAGTARIEIRSRSGEHLATLPPAASEVSSAILSPNGSRLARLDRNDVVVVTDTGTGDDLWWKNVGDSLFLFTSGDGQTLYGGAYDNHFAVPWDGKGEFAFRALWPPVSMDAIAVLDGSRIHIRASGSEIDEATVSPPFDTTEAVFVNRDKALALTTNRGRGAVVEIATGKVLYPIPLGRSLLASPSGGCLAIRTSNRLEILDAVTLVIAVAHWLSRTPPMSLPWTMSAATWSQQARTLRPPPLWYTICVPERVDLPGEPATPRSGPRPCLPTAAR